MSSGSTDHPPFLCDVGKSIDGFPTQVAQEETPDDDPSKQFQGFHAGLHGREPRVARKLAEPRPSAVQRGIRSNERLRERAFSCLFASFLSTLPFSGMEEHHRWRTRLADPPYRGNVMAKTGTLRAVSSLSGYVKATSGRVYAFSILCNRGIHCAA